MKAIFTTFIILFFTHQTSAQSTASPSEGSAVESSSAASYRLYPTQNMWTFIKLNTRNGQMWQVQFNPKSEGRFVVSLNAESLVSVDKEANDRFTLYPTQNFYSFILLDRLDGDTWQVQWSDNVSERGIVTIR